MILELKLRKVGNSVGVLLPQEALSALHVEQGDSLYLTSAPDGYRITPYDPGFKRQMEVLDDVMKRRRNVLRELAKR